MICFPATNRRKKEQFVHAHTVWERTNEANQVKTPAWVLMSFKKQQSVVKKKIYIYTCQNKQLLIICQNVIVYQNDGGKLDFKSFYGSSHFPKIREKSSLINSKKKNFYRGNEAQNY